MPHILPESPNARHHVLLLTEGAYECPQVIPNQFHVDLRIGVLTTESKALFRVEQAQG